MPLPYLQRSADLTLLNQRPRPLVRSSKNIGLPHRDSHPGLGRRPTDLQTLASKTAERLLAMHMLALLYRLQSHRRMQESWSDDIDDINLGPFEKIRKIGIDLLYPVLVGETQSPRLIQVANR